MTTLPEKVNPGDIISSDLMNLLLDEVEQLRDEVDELKGHAPGTVMVPGVFGRALHEARTIITAPDRHLAMGSVIDVTGQYIDSLKQENNLLRVLNQVPAAGTWISEGASVSLVVSVSSVGSGTGPGPSPEPTITELRKADGSTATVFEVGGAMTIVGTNFEVVSDNNLVTFNGVESEIVPSADDPTRLIHVIVPTGISGAPSAPGEPDLPGVDIVVISKITGMQASTTCTVSAPPAVPAPHLDTIDPTSQEMGQDITITGTGFSSTPVENVVLFDGIEAGEPTSSSDVEIVVTIPSGIPGLTKVGDIKTVNVSVQVNEIDSNNFIAMTVYYPIPV